MATPTAPAKPKPPPPPPKKKAQSLEAWLDGQRAALQEEREAERAEVTEALSQLSPQECQARGLTLLHLTVASQNAGLYGRVCLSLELAPALQRRAAVAAAAGGGGGGGGGGGPAAGALPAHGFGAGDEVALSPMKGTASGGQRVTVTGVVTRTTQSRIEVALSSSSSSSADGGGEEEESALEAWAGGHEHLRLDMLTNETTHRRMVEALDRLAAYNDGPALRLVDLSFGRIPPSGIRAPHVTAQHRPDPARGLLGGALLNEAQLDAVALGLATEEVALVHGPPGTGKTTAVVELILQAAVAQGQRLLVCAPSNVAVDNILERVASAATGASSNKGKGGNKAGLRMVRLGHPARLSAQTILYSLEALVAGAEGTGIVHEVRKELAVLEKRRPRDKGERRAWRGELRALRREVRQREERVVSELLKSRDLVFATCVGAASKVLKEERFDLVVIDEAAQALEPACWIPLLKAPRAVLAGDHKQLAPTVKSPKAERMGLGVTLFDRLMAAVGGTHSRMLTTQYRMHADICGWASGAMYEGKLTPAPSVAGHTLADLPHVGGKADDMTAAVLLLLDTAGCGMEEQEAEQQPPPEQQGKKLKVKTRGLLTPSRSNEGEALVAAAHVRALIETAGLKPEEIAVITPYNAQVELLRSLLAPDFPRLEVRSVDGFQGGEREAVVLSLVRSNPRGGVGFLADERRLNVAVTRAKRHCAVVADSETVASHPFLKGLIEYLETHGEQRSALEYLPDWAGAATADAGHRPTSTSTSGGGGGGGGTRSAAPRAKQQKQQKQQQQHKPVPPKPPITPVAAAAAPTGGEEGAQRGMERDSPVDDNALVAQVLAFCLAPPRPSPTTTTNAPLPRRLELSPDLSPRQRRLVHELVDKLGNKDISHESQGQGRKRRLVLERRFPQPSPPPPPPAPASAQAAAPTATATRAAGETSPPTPSPAPAPTPAPTATNAGGGGKGEKGHTLNDASARPKPPAKGNAGLGALHAERQARLQAQQAQAQQQQREQQEQEQAQAAAAAAAAAAQAKGDREEGEDDEMAAIEAAIAANARMTELVNPPSEARKARLYGWDRNLAQRKELQAKLGSRLAKSQEKRRAGKGGKEEKREGGGGGRG